MENSKGLCYQVHRVQSSEGVKLFKRNLI